MDEIMRYADYADYERAFDEEVRKEGEAFIKIGFLLRVGRDTNIIAQSGYKDVWEMAEKKYHIDKSQASRYIGVNEMFSEGGYSDTLQEKYRGFGIAKLGIMLTLPGAINEELSADFTKSEIKALKEEYDAEKTVSDLEVLMEGEEPAQSVMESNLYKVLHQLCKDEPELYCRLFSITESPAAVQEALAPDGERIFSVRIMGVGRLMLSVKGLEIPVTITNMRSSEKESYSWDELMSFLKTLMPADMESEVAWAAVYGMDFPKKEEVAPVQQKSAPKEAPKKTPAKKEPPKKESKVKKAKKPESKKPEPVVEEQLPGQDNIMNHPEYLPESMQNETEKAPIETEFKEIDTIQAENEPEKPEKTECEADLAEPVKSTTCPPGQEECIRENDGDEEACNRCWDEYVKREQARIEAKVEKTVDDVDSPAAVLDEEEWLNDLWNSIEVGLSKLGLFMQDHKGELPPHVSMELAYKNAIGVAADMERMLNHVPKHTA